MTRSPSLVNPNPNNTTAGAGSNGPAKPDYTKYLRPGYNFFHLSDLQKLGDPQITWKFEVEFYPRYNLVKYLKTVEPFIESKRLVTSHVREIELPGRNISLLKNKFLTWQNVYPNRPEWKNEVSVLFSERQYGPIMKFIRRWQEIIFQIINPANSGINYRPPSYIKHNMTSHIKATMFHTDGQRHNVSGWYINAWPKSISEAKLSMKNESMLEYTVVFAYDYCKLASYDDPGKYSATQYMSNNSIKSGEDEEGNET